MISRETLIGILITIAFHLFLALIIVSIRIREIKENKEMRFEMNVSNEIVEKPLKERMEEVNKEVLEKIYEEIRRQEAASHSNIGVNVSEKFKEELNTQKYIQRIQSEMGLKNVKVGGEGNQQNQMKVLEDLTSESKENNSIRSLKTNAPIKGKRVIYKGPTNIYYDLEGRHDVNIIVPVYKCEGSGRVVVDIVVNQTGAVVIAVINKIESRSDDCFLDAAYKAAVRSRFNSDTKAPLQQKGVITYQFIAQ